MRPANEACGVEKKKNGGHYECSKACCLCPATVQIWLMVKKLKDTERNRGAVVKKTCQQRIG